MTSQTKHGGYHVTPTKKMPIGCPNCKSEDVYVYNYGGGGNRRKHICTKCGCTWRVRI